MTEGGGNKQRYQFSTDSSGTIVYLRALQGHSGRSLVDLTLQDNVLIETGIFPYIYHVGSTFNLNSIINNGLVPGGRDLSRRQTVFRTHIRNNFFQYINHVGCAINLHSIKHSALILGGQNLSNRQTVFFLLVDPMNKNQKDPDTIDLSVPRHA